MKAAFVVVSGKERYQVEDHVTGGLCWFTNKLDAYKHCTILKALRRTYTFTDRGRA